MNLADAVARHAAERPDAPAVLMPRRTWTDAEADAVVNRVAWRLAEGGVRPGQVVGTLLPHGPLHLFVALALARMGAVLVMVHPSAPAARVEAIHAQFRLAHAIAGPGVTVELPCPAIRAEYAWGSPDGPAPAPYPAPAVSGPAPWAIQLTSGTTGAPKGVLRTHEEVQQTGALHLPLLRIGPHSRFLCCLGLYSAAILNRVVNMIQAGGAVAFAADARRTALDDIRRYGITHTFASPVAISQWLAGLPPKPAPLATLSHLLVGGGNLRESVYRLAAERITPNIHMVYGTTETGFAAIADPQVLARHPGAAGRLLPWIEAQTVDELDRPLAAGETGILRFRGTGVATGYYHEVPDAPRAMHKSFRDGWCYVGDLGRVTKDGLLYVEGRVDDVINVGGPKINASSVESILLADPAVSEVAAFGLTAPDGTPWLIATVVVRGPFDAEALRRHYEQKGGRYAGFLRLVPMTALPRNTLGKVAVHELRQAVAARLWPEAQPRRKTGS